MRVLIMCVLFLINIITPSSAMTIAKNKLVLCQIPVAHLFTHSLIAYPLLAFDSNNFMKDAYDKDCLTVKEFKNILKSLYDKNYMLIDINEIYKIENGKAVKKDFYFPKNKKPLILSFDDINYYSLKMDLGMVDKMILDKNGNLATFTRLAKEQISYDNDVILVLENFIENYPDFSFNNAKGLLCLTGFNGVLGYRTQNNSKNQTFETKQARELVKVLKEKNWKFACHSYAHFHMQKIGVENFKKDTDKWKNEVEQIVGKTDIYSYPYGEYEIENNSKISMKQQYLNDSGFKLFLGVGSDNFFRDFPINKNFVNKILLMDRVPLDGFSLRNSKERLKKYFNIEEVFDYEYRK